MGERRFARKPLRLGPLGIRQVRSPRRAAPRRHHHPPARAGAARRRDADRGRCSSSPRSSTAPASPTSRSRAAASSTAPSGAASRARGSGSARSRRGRRRRSRSRCAAASSSARGPVGGDFVRRFVASRGRERHRRLPPARPAERRLRTCARRPRRSSPPEREFDAGPALQQPAADDALVERRGACRSSAPRASCSTTRPARSSRTARGELVAGAARGDGPAGRPLLPGRRRQRARRRARGGARRRRPDRLRRLPGRARRCTASPARRSAQALAGLGLDTGVDVDALWRAADLVDEHIGDEPVTPLAPRIAVRAAAAQAPGRARRGARRRSCARTRAGDRLDEVLDELERVRDEAGSPPLAAPIGPDPRLAGAPQRALGRTATGRSSTSCATWSSGRFGTHARRRSTRRPARRRALARRAASRGARRPRRAPRRGRRARRERGGAAPARAVRRGGRAAAAHDPRARRAARSRSRRAGVDQSARRAHPRDRAHRPGVGRRRDHGRGGRHARQRAPHAGAPAVARPAGAGAGRTASVDGAAPSPRRATTRSCASRARWSAPSTARPQPGAPPFVEEGDAVAPGQTLCILEAMKLMNEVKAEVEGIVRKIHVGNAAAGRVRPAAVRARAGRTAGRSTRSLMFKRVLVANRGEIAVRVIRALHELGIEAVAVYSTADADALHVRLADHAVRVGPPPARESYLRIPSIDRRRRRRPAARRSIPATASWPRTRRSSRPASTTTSSSSARRRT